jgi:steroid delta-isomerase-like uncharacterized protein
MSEQNKVIVRRLIEDLWNQKKAAVIDEIYGENCTLNEAGTSLRGRGGARQFFTIYTTAFPDVHCTIEDILAEGDKVVLRWRSKGTHRGELQGIAPTGRPVDVPGTAIYRFSNGKIVEEHNVWDTLLMMQQIGAVGQLGQTQRAGT